MNQKKNQSIQKKESKQEEGNSSAVNEVPIPAKQNEKQAGTEGVAIIIAGSALVFDTLTHLLSALGSISRKIAIAINNHLDYTLTDVKWYTSSGKIKSSDLEIKGKKPRNDYIGEAGFVAASRTSGPGARGSAGVVSYSIEGTKNRLAIFWAVPYNLTGDENRFKVSIIHQNVATDEALYKDMDKNYSMKTKGNKARAATGAKSWDSQYFIDVEASKKIYCKLEAVMGTSGESTLNVSIKKVREETLDKDSHPMSGFYSLKNKTNGEYRTNRATKMSKNFTDPECIFLFEELLEDNTYAIRNMKGSSITGNKEYLDCTITSMSEVIKDQCQQWKFRPVPGGEENEYYIQNVKNGEHMTRKASQLSQNTGKDEVYILNKRTSKNI